MPRGQPPPPGRQGDARPERAAARDRPDDYEDGVDEEVGAEVGLEVMPALDLGDRAHLVFVELRLGRRWRVRAVLAREW